MVDIAIEKALDELAGVPVVNGGGVDGASELAQAPSSTAAEAPGVSDLLLEGGFQVPSTKLDTTLDVAQAAAEPMAEPATEPAAEPTAPAANGASAAAAIDDLGAEAAAPPAAPQPAAAAVPADEPEHAPPAAAAKARAAATAAAAAASAAAAAAASSEAAAAAPPRGAGAAPGTGGGAGAAHKAQSPLNAPKSAIMTGGNPDAELVRAGDALEEVRSAAIKVTDLSKQFKEDGGPLCAAAAAAAAGASAGGASAAERAAAAAALTEHDLVNTANVALVLQAGEFKLRPGVDSVPYDKLKELRLEDGLDVSRKEEYLSASEFKDVFGISKEDFAAMPSWKRINAKKAKGLF